MQKNPEAGRGSPSQLCEAHAMAQLALWLIRPCTDDNADSRAAEVTSKVSVQKEFHKPACGSSQSMGDSPFITIYCLPYFTVAHKRFAGDEDFLQFRIVQKTNLCRKRSAQTKILKMQLGRNGQLCSAGTKNKIRSVSNSGHCF